MMISEFAAKAGVTTDTVRFYIRLGLVMPEVGTKGGRNAYQFFNADHLRAVNVIRMAQALGMSLKEIAVLTEERREGRITRARKIEITTELLTRIEAKAADLKTMTRYLTAKIDWLEAGEPEHVPEPSFPSAVDEPCFLSEPTGPVPEQKVNPVRQSTPGVRTGDGRQK